MGRKTALLCGDLKQDSEERQQTKASFTLTEPTQIFSNRF